MSWWKRNHFNIFCWSSFKYFQIFFHSRPISDLYLKQFRSLSFSKLSSYLWKCSFLGLQTDNDNVSTISYAISKRLKLELPDWMGGPTDRPTEKWLLKLRIRNLKMSRILATAMVVWSDVERLRESTTWYFLGENWLLNY